MPSTRCLNNRQRYTWPLNPNYEVLICHVCRRAISDVIDPNSR